ncbi:MAG: hypothetical protein AMXMBFR84_02090 [Candidatus Hydrogenedentota bacterium]
MMARTCFTISLAILLPAAAYAQSGDLGEIAFRQALKDMGTDLRLMCVAAHPDDEDGATLALYRMLYGYKTFAVIATRGEGGQNEIGPELYNELGVIRTREMMAAAEIEGAELHYLNYPEFGYSKSMEETFEVWGKDAALKTLVRTIRTLRPDVIITNHGLRQDHGHHQAVGQLLLDAFEAAANRNMFPELILEEDLEPWQVTRLYMRLWQDAPESGAVTVDFGIVDPVRGKTYAEIAADALRTHTSQGMEMFIRYYLTGRPKAYYRLVKEAPQDMSWTENRVTPAPVVEKLAAPAQGPLFEGLVDRVAPKARALGSASVIGAIDAPEVKDTFQSVEALKPFINAPLGRDAVKPFLLRHAANMAERKEQGPSALRDWERANRAAAIAAELRLDVKPSDAAVTPGQGFELQASLSDFGDLDAQRVAFAVETASHFPLDSTPGMTVSIDAAGTAKAQLPVRVPDTQPQTIPHADHLFDPTFLVPQMTVVARVTCADGVELELRKPVYVDIAPKVSLAFLDAPYLLRLNHDKTVRVKVLVTNNTTGPFEGVLNVSPSPGLTAEALSIPFKMAAEGDQKLIPIDLAVGEQLSPRGFHVTAMADNAGDAVHGIVQAMELDVPDDVRIGVIQSYDDTFVNALEKMGVPHQAITLEDFAPDRLDAFTAILVDIRAYLARPDLRANNAALLEYVQRGGVLLVQYQKTMDWKEDYAPYPIKLSQNRVTREDAPIEVLAADHPLFTTPNAIGADDWTGWIQERGLYFPETWSQEYTPLLACSDPGETIPPGACLIAKHGEGTYLYTALGWYRQIRELHPGAMRVFANMIALGEKR